MADIDTLPQNIIDELKASGVKFDEDGNIIDEYNISDSEDDNENADTNEDQDSEDEGQDLEDDRDDQSDEDDSEEGSETEDDDQDEEPEQKPKKKVTSIKKEEVKPSLSLTSKKAKIAEKDNSEIEELRKTVEELKSKLNSSTKSEDDTVPDIQKEALAFKKFRMQEFANSVKSTVNSLSLGASFDDIVESQEWADYLSSKMLGSRVSDMLVASIKDTNLSDVTSFYKDFSERYLPMIQKSKKIDPKLAKATGKPKSKLEEVAVPSKTQTDSVAIKKNSLYLYTENDYIDMLDKAQRGRISLDDFDKFEKKYEAASKAGKVKLG